MDVNIPPVVTVLGGLAVVVLCFVLRIPIFLVGLLSLVLLAYTVVLNRNMFEIDYDHMTFTKSIAAIVGNAPINGLPSIMIIATVVILALGYIIYLFGLSSLFTNAAMILPSFSSLWLNRSSQSQALSTPQSQYKNYKNSGFVSAFNRAI